MLHHTEAQLASVAATWHDYLELTKATLLQEARAQRQPSVEMRPPGSCRLKFDGVVLAALRETESALTTYARDLQHDGTYVSREQKSRLIEYRRLNDCNPGCFMMNLPVMLTERVHGVAISGRLPRFWR